MSIVERIQKATAEARQRRQEMEKRQSESLARLDARIAAFKQAIAPAVHIKAEGQGFRVYLATIAGPQHEQPYSCPDEAASYANQLADSLGALAVVHQ